MTLNNSLQITISNDQQLLTFDETRLIEVIKKTLEEQSVPAAEISYVIVDNKAIHQVNRDFLEHDFPTDVITFPLSEPGEETLEGEIVLSAEMAMEIAADVGWSTEEELLLYAIHGTLHLCGFDDLEETAALQMRAEEFRMLTASGISPKPDDDRWQTEH